MLAYEPEAEGLALLNGALRHPQPACAPKFVQLGLLLYSKSWRSCETFASCRQITPPCAWSSSVERKASNLLKCHLDRDTCMQTFKLMQNSDRPLLKEHALIMHGQMEAKQKQLVLDAFKKGMRRLLVSTVVIEVGIDVPDATLMVVEHAERFGLLQLHQLRGRVGRSTRQSACVLVTAAQQACDRLQVLEVLTTNADS
jgi:superfamily II DNA helicase RecQ